MRDRHPQYLPDLRVREEWILGVLHAQIRVLADEMKIAIADQRAGQESTLAQDLKTVADAEHQDASLRLLDHRRHDGRIARDCSAAQIVAVTEAPRQDD